MDGIITINTAINTKELEKQIANAEKELKKLEKENQQLSDKKAKLELDLKPFNDQQEEAKRKIEELENKIEEFNQKSLHPSKFGLKPTQGADMRYKAIEYEGQLEALQQSTSTEMPEKYQKISQELSNINSKIEENVKEQEKFKDKIDDTEKSIKRVNNAIKKQKFIDDVKESAEAIKNLRLNITDGIGDGMSKITKKVGKWALAIFAVRSAYSGVRSAINIITSNNDKLKSQIESMKYSLAYTLEPLITWFVNTLYQILGVVRTIIKQLTGKDIFASAKKNSEATKKNMKSIVAGFDEMNVLSDNSSGGSAGSKPVEFANAGDLEKTFENVIDNIKKWWTGLVDFLENTDWVSLGRNVWESLKTWFTSIDWAGITSSIFEGIGALCGAIVGFIGGLASGIWEDIKSYFTGYIDEAGGNIVLGIFNGIVDAIANVGKWIYDNILVPFLDGFCKAFGIASPSKVMEEEGQYIIAGLYEGVKGIWNAVKGVFEGLVNSIKDVLNTMWNWIKTGVSNLWERIKGVIRGIANWIYNNVINPVVNGFNTMTNSIKNAFNKVKSTISSVMSSVWNIVKTPLNWIISAINTIIKGLNKVSFEVPNWVPAIGGQRWGFNIPTIPRLAKGGIINMPSRGVPVGNAIAGERGAEGVIPLTDSQQMELLGEAIGKYITINANIVNSMNGRIISRELQKIQNESNFAYNR